MRTLTLAVSAAVAVATLAGTASPASAQGCILLRQTAPAFGTAGSPNQEVGTYSLTFTGRNSTADHHYNGTTYQAQRQALDTYVVNQQNSITATVAYQWTPRFALNVGIPFIAASWGIPSPQSAGETARANENTHGLGDITTLARYALLSPTAAHSWNLMIGGGMKFPTGNYSATDVFPASSGLAATNLERHTDISTQPGDGGWGYVVDLQGYKAMGRVMSFFSGTYLLNPRDVGAPTRGTLVTADTSASALSAFNTVSDQYVVRAGGEVALFHGLGASMAWRLEGVPRYDLIGDSHGFRRPGMEMYWEPGVTLTLGRQTISFNMPVGYYFNRQPNPYTSAAGDSTFPKYVAIATYSMRLGTPHMDHLGPSDQPHSAPPSAPRQLGRPQASDEQPADPAAPQAGSSQASTASQQQD